MKNLISNLMERSRDPVTVTFGEAFPLDVRRIIVRIVCGLHVTMAENQLALSAVEDFSACVGYALISRETGKIVERFKAGLPVSLRELETIIYEVQSGPFGEFFPLREFA
jgi:hypothetical protein